MSVIMHRPEQAGADPDAADDSGAKPIAAAAAAGEREVVEALFPLTTQPADGAAAWSVTGLMDGAASAGGVAGLSLDENRGGQQLAAVRVATPAVASSVFALTESNLQPTLTLPAAELLLRAEHGGSPSRLLQFAQVLPKQPHLSCTCRGRAWGWSPTMCMPALSRELTTLDLLHNAADSTGALGA